MSPLLQRLRSPTWQYALPGGLASLPLTLALHLRSVGNIWDASGIVLCALVVGYLAKRRGLESTPVGLRAGAVGAFPILLSVLEMVPLVLAFTQPAWFTALQLGLVTVAVPLLVGFTALVGGVAARFGGWLAERSGHPRTTVGA